MSNKTPTPIQQAIEERKAMIAILKLKESAAITPDQQGALKMLIDIVNNGIDNLALLLPAERNFAEIIWKEARFKQTHEIQYNHRDEPYVVTHSITDFSTFYKNNYEDGK